MTHRTSRIEGYSRRVANGWPHKYGGPADVLNMRAIRWPSNPVILQRENGAWEWVCEPLYLRNDALTDLETLRTAGWDIRINPHGNRLRVHIRELTEAPTSRENPDA